MANNENPILELKNSLVLEKIKNEGVDSVSEWIHNLANDPKPSLKCIKTSLRQTILKKHTRLNKTKKREAGKTGKGTYAYWAEQLYKIPKATDRKVQNYAVAEIAQTITRNQVFFVRDELAEEKKRVDILTGNIKACEMKLESRNTELKRLRSRETFHRNKALKLEQKVKECELESEKSDGMINVNLKVISEMYENVKDENLQLNEKILYLEETIRKLKDETIVTQHKQSHAFTSQFREMVYKLLQEGVTNRQVGPVIEAVLAFANKKVDNLPSEKTIRNMNSERLGQSKQQCSEKLSMMENDHNGTR